MILPGKDNWKLGRRVFAVALLSWLSVLILAPTRIPGGDFICFKDPGVNLARGEGLVERASPANHSLTPRFYSNYPPFFPTLYGAAVFAFGLRPKVDAVFDFMITAAGGILYWFYVTPRKPTSDRQPVSFFLNLALIALLLPIGAFWSQRERPDYLAFIVLLASFFVLRKSRTRGNVFLAGFIAGLNSLISPFAFIISCVGLACLVAPSEITEKFQLKRVLQSWIFLALGTLIPIASLFLIYWIFDSSSISRLASTGTGQSTQGHAGLGYFVSLLSGDARGFFSAFLRYDSFRYKWMLLHLLVVAVAAVAAGLYLKAWWRVCAVLALAAFPLAAFPYQPCYMSITAATLVAVFTGLTSPISPVRGWLITFSLVVIALVALPFTAKEFVIAYQARDSYRAMETEAAGLRAPGEKSVTAAISPSSYFFFKRAGFVVNDIAYIPDPRGIDLFALTRNGEKADAAEVFPRWWPKEDVEQVGSRMSELVRKKSKEKFSGRIWTWDADLYRRLSASNSE